MTRLTVPTFFPVGSLKASRLNRVPGPGVHAVRPETSISQRLDGSVAAPGNRQPIPMMAIGSRGPPLSPRSIGLPLSIDHGVDAVDCSSLLAVSLPALSMGEQSVSLSIVIFVDSELPHIQGGIQVASTFRLFW